MKKLGRINVNFNSEILSKDEQKQIIGGGFDCWRSGSPGSTPFSTIEAAIAYCQVWVSLGQDCKCYNDSYGGYY